MPTKTAGSVQNMFAEVPATYELVNHVLTLGLDVLWRRRAARIAARAGGTDWADMCTGTGEMAVYLSRLAPKRTKIYAIDFSGPMMEKARAKPQAAGISFVEADIKALPFDDGSLDLITMSFATRNINLSRDILIRSFAEYYRVLKPGGRFVNMETSRPPFAPVRKCFDLYVKLFVKQIGGRISGAGTAYAYLAGTIPRFYGAEELAQIMTEAGFDDVSFKRLMFGAAAIHQAVKQ
ncbi:MAG: ubiquinone/menaquinone biosynthesis methyltransferase [Planctomycetota bacterium]|jgi:demethylmenaquinone methyltransferase/2-methoxy-6-polyprenyl-1,4-benzoquinol methylase